MLVGSGGGSCGDRVDASPGVRVSFRTAAAPSLVIVRATPAGTFTAAAPAGLTYDRCGSPLVVSAAGASGDRVVLRLAPLLCRRAEPLNR